MPEFCASNFRNLNTSLDDYSNSMSLFSVAYINSTNSTILWSLHCLLLYVQLTTSLQKLRYFTRKWRRIITVICPKSVLGLREMVRISCPCCSWGLCCCSWCRCCKECWRCIWKGIWFIQEFTATHASHPSWIGSQLFCVLLWNKEWCRESLQHGKEGELMICITTVVSVLCRHLMMLLQNWISWKKIHTRTVLWLCNFWGTIWL